MYRKISLLPGLAILAIIVVHAVAQGEAALFWWGHRYQEVLPVGYDPLKTPQYFILVFLRQALYFGVQAFYFVAGIFASYGIDKTTGNIRWRTISSRILALLTPYIIWTTVPDLIEAAIGHIQTPKYYLIEFLFGINGTWYVPALIMFYLISPLIIYFAKRNWKLLLVISGLIQIIFTALGFTWLSYQASDPVKNFFLGIGKYELIFNWFFYFPCGVVAGMYLPKFTAWSSRNWKYILIFCIVFLFSAYSLALWKSVYIRDPEDWINGLVHMLVQVYAIGLVIGILGFCFSKDLASKHLLKLNSLTYGIYLTHHLFIIYVTKLIYRFVPLLLSNQLLLVFILFFIGLGGSLFLFKIIRISPARNSFRYLFG